MLLFGTASAGISDRRGGKFPSLEEMERSYIKWVLNETANSKIEAAAALGIDRVSLWRKLKKYEIE